MSSLQRFNFNSQKVRTVSDDEHVWFVASDVSKVLGYRMASDMTRRLDADDRGTRSVRTPSGDQTMTVISHTGLIEAALYRKSDSAKQFRKWVTHTVLPEVMQKGLAPAPALVFDWANPAFQRQMLVSQLATLDRAEAAESQLAIAAPKAALADTIIAKGDVHTMQRASNLLEDEGFQFTGRNTLFQWLRDHRWVEKNSRNPLQTAITAGYLKRKYYEDYAPTTLVTAKGLAKIHQMMLAELEEERVAGFRQIEPLRSAPSATKRQRTRRLPAA